MEKPILEIDGERVSTLEEFYAGVSRTLIYRGHNLDAFGDILGGGFGTSEHGFILVWRGSDISRERLGYPETIRQPPMIAAPRPALESEELPK